MSNLSLKTVLVHNSVTPWMIETNLQKVGLVNRVPCAKSREKLHNSFREYACCFCKYKHCTVTYFILFVCLLKQRNNDCNDRSAKFYSLILTFSTLCVVHNLISLRKLTNPAFWFLVWSGFFYLCPRESWVAEYIPSFVAIFINITCFASWTYFQAIQAN